MRSAKAAVVMICAVVLTAFSMAAGQVSQTGADAQWLALGQELAGVAPAMQDNPAPAGDSGACATSQPAGCQSRVVCCEEKPWEVKFFVYGWLPSVEGKAGGKKVSNVDVDLCDTIHGLKYLECMAPFDFEARLGNWGFIMDFLYVKLGHTVERKHVSAHLTAKETIMELAGYYRAVDCPVWPNKPGSSLKFDVLAGARENRIEGAVGLQLPNRAVAISRAEEWWDPFVGGRVTWQATEQWSFFARADVGGYGMENTSHIVWQFIGGVEYDFCRNVFLQLGYRLLDTHFDRGSGSAAFTYDITMKGPYLALGVKF